MKYEDILQLAIRVNIKEVDEKTFEKKVGVSFFDFLRLKENNKAFLVEWRAYLKDRAGKAKIAKLDKKDYSKECTCDEQFEWISSHRTDDSKNASWRCTVHGLTARAFINKDTSVSK